jgi:hypothetical protein
MSTKIHQCARWSADFLIECAVVLLLLHTEGILLVKTQVRVFGWAVTTS